MAVYPITEPPGRLGVITAYLMIYVVWGSTYYFIGTALQGFPPFLLGGMRFCTAGLLLLLAGRARGEDIFRGPLVRKSAVSGIILLFVDMAVVMLAQQYLSSSLVAIIASSTAIWIIALDVPMWRRNFRSISVFAGIAAGFLGVGLLFAEQLGREEGGGQGAHGILLLVFGCVSWALGTLYAKYRSCAEEAVNNVGGAAWQMLAAGVMFWCWALVRKEPENMDWEEVPASAWLSLLYLVLFGSVLAYTSYIWLLEGSSGGGSRHARLCEPPGGRRPGVCGGRGRDDVGADGRAVRHPGEHRAGEENASGRFRRERARAFPCGRHGVQKGNIVPGI